jgi:hypothetical protein
VSSKKLISDRKTDTFLTRNETIKRNPQMLDNARGPVLKKIKIPPHSNRDIENGLGGSDPRGNGLPAARPRGPDWLRMRRLFTKIRCIHLRE